MKEIRQDRIDVLTKSRTDFFDKYYREFYEIKDFPNSSYYFHSKVINMIKKSEFGKLFDNNHYFEYIYATLATWGMDRLSKSASLYEFSTFKNSAIKNKDKLISLSKIKLKNLDNKKIKEIKDDLSDFFKNLKVMETLSKLVGVSKALHHFLPELVLPIDRRYTVNFFYNKKLNKYPSLNNNDEENIFLEIFEKSYVICKKLNLTEEDLTQKWDTSIPKLIDNAIIGFVEKEITSQIEEKLEKSNNIESLLKEKLKSNFEKIKEPLQKYKLGQGSITNLVKKGRDKIKGFSKKILKN